MQEVWEVCQDYPDYAISNFGRVEDLERRHIVPSRTNAQGLLMVTIRDTEFRQRTRMVALLVAKLFVPNQNEKHFDSVIHLNGDRTDCRYFNLMWRSRPFALQYHDMFNQEPYRLSVRRSDTGEYFYSLRELCQKYGLIEKLARMSMRNNEPCFPYGWKVEEVTF